MKKRISRTVAHTQRRKGGSRFSLPLVFLIILCIGILGVIILIFRSDTQKELVVQENTSTAQLSWLPNSSSSSPVTVQPGQTIAADLVITPNQHKITSVAPVISYDPQTVEVLSVSPNTQNFPATFKKPDLSKSGVVSFSIAITPPLDNAISKPTTVATITFRVLSGTSSSSTGITIDSASAAYSLSPNDSPSANVIHARENLYLEVN